jgi:hypothetical protein
MKMHWCTAKVNLAGMGFYIVVFGPERPVSWPEAQVLFALHGDENVFEVKPCGVTDASPSEEKRRLLGKYGPVVERVFPGRTFRMEMVMPGETTDQVEVDSFGETITTIPEAVESDEPMEPPTGPAVFKPNKHPRQTAGA